MKRICVSILAAFILVSLAVVPGYSADCIGQWKKIPNYKQRMGAPCKALGLDTHRGTCQPGQAYETLCDDAAGGLYRTCQGPTPCNNALSGNNNCGNWDFNYNTPCPQGYVNMDCKGGCEKVSGNRPCEAWDNNYNKPCPQGYVNLDCKGGCEPRLR